MAAMDENRGFFGKMDEEQKRLDEQQGRQNEEFDKITSEVLRMLRAQQEEDPVTKTLKEVSERIDTFTNKRISVRLMSSEIKALEEVSPEFVAATQTGFSEEEIKRITVTMFDAIFGALNIGKLESSLSNVMLSVALGKRIDFSQFNGIGVYNYIRNTKSFTKLLQPEYKKRVIYSKAVKIVVEAKTISFNTAVKRAIREFNEEMLDLKIDTEDQELLDDISGIINPIIDLYLDNEMAILGAIMSKTK